MDTLREDETRSVNHHGQIRNVGEKKQEDKLFILTNELDKVSYNDMTQRNEKDLVEARKQFYENAVTINVDYLKISQTAGKHWTQKLLVGHYLYF